MSPISLILILTLNQSNDRTTLAVKQLYPLQQSCKLISSIPISTSSFRFPNSSIPWFKSKSGNHWNTAICHIVLGHDQTNSSEIYCLSHLHTHDNTLANWHPPYPSQHRATASPSRRFRGSNPRAEITETQQYAILYLVTIRPTQVRYTACPIYILTTTHLQIDILHTHLNIELQLLQVVDSVVQIQERKSPKHSNMPYRTWSRAPRFNYTILRVPFTYSWQHSCKLTSSIPISTSSYSFSKSSIPWFKSKSGNHGTQQSIIL